MLKETKNPSKRLHIKQHQIHGIEIRDDMFSIATTNMILRGDGQSNLICEDFLAQDPGELQLRGGGITVGFMNPPYSQAKNKDTANLSELCFIRHLLNSITEGGRAAVIVPVSAMIGKTKDDKAIKKEILKNHTLEGVISLNKDTWNTFFVGDLFTVRRPQARSEKQYQFGSIPFIASGNTNNGLTKCCMPKKEEILDEGNCITISPVDGSTFYQETAFLGRGGAGSSILILYNSNMNRFSGLFIARMLRQTCSKYSYGKMGNKESIKREKVMLPINDNGKPDYLFMEQYIKYIILKLKTKYLKEK